MSNNAEEGPRFDVKVKLTGHDGNALSIMGRVAAALRKAGATQSEISQYTEESMSGDYAHLLQTAGKWVNVR